MRFALGTVAALVLVCGMVQAAEKDVMDRVDHHYADSDGVKIHYVTMGEGPLVVFIHGFPDFWYSWRYQMEGLSKDFRVAAMDTRGYNKSDKPEGQPNYAMALLVADVAAVVKSEGRETATIVGHDWGGAIAWSVAMMMPEMVDQLMIVNLPHMRGITRELEHNEEHCRLIPCAPRKKEPHHYPGDLGPGDLGPGFLNIISMPGLVPGGVS